MNGYNDLVVPEKFPADRRLVESFFYRERDTAEPEPEETSSPAEGPATV